MGAGLEEGVDPLTLEYAKSFLGVPYQWGGASPGGIDCSGLIVEILCSAGVFKHGYDNTAQGIYSDYSKEWPTLLYAMPGALVFYGKGLASISHVALCMDGYRVLEAGGGDESVRSKDDAWRKGAFVRLRPINYRKDFISMLMPRYPLAKLPEIS